MLVAEGEGRKDGATRRMSGRARDNRLVHFARAGVRRRSPRPGDMVTVEITYAAPHHLVADGPDGGSAIKTLRRTRSGDAWQARQEQPEAERRGAAVTLGMPSIGKPAAAAEPENACGVC